MLEPLYHSVHLLHGDVVIHLVGAKALGADPRFPIGEIRAPLWRLASALFKV
jgi:hypothetical protein